MAFVFDLDGVLIDSEPHWQIAETEVFQLLGLPFSIDMAHQTTGMRCDKVVDYWFARYPWQGASKIEVENMIVNKVCERMLKYGEEMSEATKTLQWCKAQYGRLAIATSSPVAILNAVIEKFDWHFIDITESAEQLDHPKPHPQVYLNACEKLGKPSHLCFAVEDSKPGMIAALAANMSVIAFGNEWHSKSHFANAVISELNEIPELPLLK